MSKTRFGIGLLGCGTVGNGVLRLLQEKAEMIERRHGVRFDVKRILVRRPDIKRNPPIKEGLLARSFADILDDREIDIVVEVMGEVTPTKDYILDSFKAGKAVITANKALMGSVGEKLVERARQNGCFFGYAAAVTGFHHLCPAITSSLMVKSLAGIFNGTSNYILSQIENGDSYDDALKCAQDAGYAEKNPTDDVEGFDTRNKLVIVSRLAFGVFLDRNDIPVSGIRDLSKQEMEYAKELGYTIKLLGVSRVIDDDMISAVVSPFLVPFDNPLARVKGVNNGLQVFDDIRGMHGMEAEGAGSQPTAMAILTDLISMAKGERILWPAPAHFGTLLRISKAQVANRYYVRMQVANHPGVLADVTRVFGKNNVNIDRVVQKDGRANAVPLVMICGPTKERNLLKVLHEIAARKKAMSEPVFLPVLDSLKQPLAEPVVEDRESAYARNYPQAPFTNLPSEASVREHLDVAFADHHQHVV